MSKVNINKVYQPLYTTDKRYILVTGGRGSLKSTTVHDFICRLTYQMGQGILFTRYTMTSATKSIIPEFIETLKRNNSEVNFHVTKDKIINLTTGSFIIFSGIKTSSGNQTANLKSLSGITTWVIEEGEDFDDEIVTYLIDEFKKDNGIDLRQDKLALQRLKEAGEKAKIELSSSTETEINLPFITADQSGPKHLTIKLSRAKLEAIIGDLLNKSLKKN